MVMRWRDLWIAHFGTAESFWFRTLILDCLVSCHDHCDFDESCVLDNDAKKKAVKKHRELTSVSLCF